MTTQTVCPPSLRLETESTCPPVLAAASAAADEQSPPATRKLAGRAASPVATAGMCEAANAGTANPATAARGAAGSTLAAQAAPGMFRAKKSSVVVKRNIFFFAQFIVTGSTVMPSFF